MRKTMRSGALFVLGSVLFLPAPAAFAQGASRDRHDVVRCHPLRFVDDENTVHGTDSIRRRAHALACA